MLSPWAQLSTHRLLRSVQRKYGIVSVNSEALGRTPLLQTQENWRVS